MLKLNKMTDYAVVVLGQMAREPGRVRTAAALSDSTAIPLPTVSKLLKILAGTGLVTSHRGANGGYSIDVTAEQVTVARIVQAIDGPIALTACVEEGDGGCEVSNSCPISGNWDRVNQAVRAALEEVTLADLLDPTEMFPLRPAVREGSRSPAVAES
ncbi:MAG: SUF system Fe-S cluster assembly regulator [Nisaea sp.]|jgi:FeS assembly SUF system regulator|uniref:SUF system Fe-S cluster assembly regulator n=1 Tax=Nisaea sp. TaxID=2024842 RepID=UPI001B07098B|nr:SUF system Fe-S cluster assembly regulator [Nisaea sp.]MBO6560060.1 SUF system Fe-S cluster assembly regulator [Nisaea sp.]